MMQTSSSKNQASAADYVQRSQCAALRPGALSWGLASLVVAVPLPAFANVGSGENVAIPFSASNIDGLAGKGGASGTVVDDFDAIRMLCKFGPSAAVMAPTGGFERHSLRYQMKVK